jgi:hypothetical protein
MSVLHAMKKTQATQPNTMKLAEKRLTVTVSLREVMP